jgi:hypothetical protein
MATTSPSKKHYIETVYEMLDELDWGEIRWDGYDEISFKALLSDAWDRAARDGRLLGAEQD